MNTYFQRARLGGRLICEIGLYASIYGKYMYFFPLFLGYFFYQQPVLFHCYLVGVFHPGMSGEDDDSMVVWKVVVLVDSCGPRDSHPHLCSYTHLLYVLLLEKIPEKYILWWTT